VTYVEHLSHNRRIVRNVVGVLPGSDRQKAREAVVIGGHYDHVGLGGRLSVVPELTGQIHNGADDNASGTSAVMEMAKAASSQRERFPRTLVFIAFAGEERGLLGSAHYAGKPLIDARRSVGHIHHFSKETALATLEDCGYRVIDHFYTSGRTDLGGLGWKSQLMRIPRHALYSMSPDAAARMLGGYSLLVLAQ